MEYVCVILSVNIQHFSKQQCLTVTYKIYWVNFSIKK